MSKKVKIIIISVISLIVVAVFTLVILEQSRKCKVKIVNSTDKNITNLNLMFETEEDSKELRSLYNGELKSGQSYSGSYEAVDLSGTTADLGMIVTFEGEEEIFVYDGYFSDRYDGFVEVEFFQAEGEYRVRLSATTGLFKNADSSYMKDDEIYFDFENADWDYVDWYDEDIDLEELDMTDFESDDSDSEDFDMEDLIEME